MDDTSSNHKLTHQYNEASYGNYTIDKSLINSKVLKEYQNVCPLKKNKLEVNALSFSDLIKIANI